MLVWGGLHGLYLLLERVPSLWRPSIPLDEQPRWKQYSGRIVTFAFTALAWVPFKTDIPSTLAYWKGLFSWTIPNKYTLVQAFTGSDVLSFWSNFNIPSPVLLVVLAAAMVFDHFQHHAGKEDFLLEAPRWVQVLLVIILLGVSLLAFFSDTTAPFVYQAF